MTTLKGRETLRPRTSHIVVHCAATKPTMDIGAKQIREWHLQQGYFDIGYHYVIRRNGEIESGRSLDAIGAHAIGFNSQSIGVCLVGGVDKAMKQENNFTPEQFAALKRLLDSLLQQFPGCEVIGHRDVPGTKKACPSFDAKAWWAAAHIEIKD